MRSAWPQRPAPALQRCCSGASGLSAPSTGGYGSARGPQFRILGPLEVLSERGPIALGGIKPRAVLAVLLLHANEPVSAERLAHALWGEDAPAGAVKTVQVHVSRLRKALGTRDIAGDHARRLPPRVRPGELDSERFEQLRQRRAARAHGGQAGARRRRAARGARALARAAARRRRRPSRSPRPRSPARGAAAGGARGPRRGRPRRRPARGARRRAAAARRRAPDARAARRQLMLALYRCGRQAEALEVYRAARAGWSTSSASSPGRAARPARRMLRQDVSLELRGRARAAARARRRRRAAARRPRRGAAWLRARWERARRASGALVTVAGGAGIGKTRLAAELAGEVHRDGATSSTRRARPAERSLAHAAHGPAAPRPTLLVVDDADRAGAEVCAALERLTDAIAAVRCSSLVIAQDEDALAAAAAPTTSSRSGRSTPTRSARSPAAYAPHERRRRTRPNGCWRPAAASRGGSMSSRRSGRDARPRAASRRSPGGPPPGGPSCARWRRSSPAASSSSRRRASARDARRRRTRRSCARSRAWPRSTWPTRRTSSGASAWSPSSSPGSSARRCSASSAPSGSGKSSVVRAGLLPALARRRAARQRGWRQVRHPPRRAPAARAATRHGGRRRDGRARARRRPVRGDLHRVPRRGRARGVRRASSSRARDAGDARCVVVLAIRADYYGRCAAYPRARRACWPPTMSSSARCSATSCGARSSAGRARRPARRAGARRGAGRRTSSTSPARCRCSRPRCSSCGSAATGGGCATPVRAHRRRPRGGRAARRGVVRAARARTQQACAGHAPAPRRRGGGRRGRAAARGLGELDASAATRSGPWSRSSPSGAS